MDAGGAGAARPTGAARRALIVVPTYEEVGNLAALVEAVLRAAPSASVLVVDDASPDGTGRLAERLAASEPRLHVLHRPEKRGLGTAYVDGFRWGLARGYDLFCEMDADFSHDPRDLPRLFEALARGADVVVGSRNVPGGSVEGWAPWRRLLSTGGSLCAQALLRARVRDMTSGFKVFTREALEALELESLRARGFAFQIETTHRALARGLDVVEVPIAFSVRRAGRSKLSRAIVFEAALVLWRLRTRGGPAARATPAGGP
ncbi:MAG: polyprenol monophosphomannose synthase, partial [Polyangiaceae bacterium]|nr:polyprenol monophosphomannose synthase [Polyangiaceae bacterium]